MAQTTKQTKKTIYLPSFIGDWTTFSPPMGAQESIAPLNLGKIRERFRDAAMDDLLLFHHEFFHHFYNELSSQLDANVTMETLTFNASDHASIINTQSGDHYMADFKTNNINQIRFKSCQNATKCLTHRLCGGTYAPDNLYPTSLELSLMPVITTLFFTILQTHWKSIFSANMDHVTSSFGDYHYSPKQHETDPVIEIKTTFRLFNKTKLNISLLYSLETIEACLNQFNQLNNSIKDTVSLSKKTLKKTTVNAKTILGKTSLSIDDIQQLSIGDVIVLDQKTLDDPLDLIIDESVTFNSRPMVLDNQQLGVQIISLPTYNHYLNDLNKPTAPSLVKNTSLEQPVTESFAPTPTADELNVHESTFSHDDMAPNEFDAPTELYSEQLPAINDGTEHQYEHDDNNQNKAEEEYDDDEQNNDSFDDDDFSWDDLDDE